MDHDWNVDEPTAKSLKPQFDRVREMIQAAQNANNPPELISLKDLENK